MEAQSRTSPVLALDSITHMDAGGAGRVLVAASHGGVYSAYLAARGRARAVIFNDAGVGLDEAGIGGLAYLEKLGIPAAAALHTSCRIGDGRDMTERGVLGHANAVARGLGCVPGMTVRDAAARLAAAAAAGEAATPPAAAENRFLLVDGAPRTWGLDSASLVTPADAGQIVVTGSHGGLMGGNPALAVKAEVLAALFNDAGVGIDGAGLTRLPALDARGIAAATVDHRSARIGDARSSWETGRLSCANRAAAALGGRPDMPVAEFCALARAHAQRKG